MVLMDKWHETSDKGESLPAYEQVELKNLVQDELRASAARTFQIVNELRKTENY